VVVRIHFHPHVAFLLRAEAHERCADAEDHDVAPRALDDVVALDPVVAGFAREIVPVDPRVAGQRPFREPAGRRESLGAGVTRRTRTPVSGARRLAVDGSPGRRWRATRGTPVREGVERRCRIDRRVLQSVRRPARSLAAHRPTPNLSSGCGDSHSRPHSPHRHTCRPHDERELAVRPRLAARHMRTSTRSPRSKHNVRLHTVPIEPG
jgi:hypothetical protein